MTWEQQVVEAYQKSGGLKSSASSLGVSWKRVRKILLDAGVLKPQGRPRGKGKKKHHGSLVKWLKEHPNERLPTSPQAIAQKTLCSEDAVNSYLYRKRKSMAQTFVSLGDLRAFSTSIIDTRARRIPTKAISSYGWKVDPFSFRILVKANLKPQGVAYFSFSTSDLKSFLQHQQNAPCQSEHLESSK